MVLVKEFIIGWLIEIFRSIVIYLENIKGLKEARFQAGQFNGLKQLTEVFDVTLETGALFEVDGFIKISKVNAPHPQGNGSTTTLGSVSVTIS